MGYWGWRPLICGVFISTWVVGCNVVTDYTAPSAAPSAYPNVTLTTGRLATARISAAPTRAAPTQPRTQQPSAAPETSPQAPVATPLPLDVQAPICYETRPGSLLCLGRVLNPLEFPVERVTVEVSLVEADGTVRLSRSTVEQPIIPSGSFAAYQAVFERDLDQFASIEASLISAVQDTDADNPLLLVESVDGEILDGRVLINALIFNPGTENAEILRVFVTLLDTAGRVIGYRVVHFDADSVIHAGEQLPVHIEMTPQVSDVTPEYALYVEARVIRD